MTSMVKFKNTIFKIYCLLYLSELFLRLGAATDYRTAHTLFLPFFVCFSIELPVKLSNCFSVFFQRDARQTACHFAQRCTSNCKLKTARQTANRMWKCLPAWRCVTCCAEENSMLSRRLFVVVVTLSGIGTYRVAMCTPPRDPSCSYNSREITSGQRMIWMLKSWPKLTCMSWLSCLHSKKKIIKYSAQREKINKIIGIGREN